MGMLLHTSMGRNDNNGNTVMGMGRKGIKKVISAHLYETHLSLAATC